MERIASFSVDHNKLTPGLYLSRRDGDIVTLDLRFKKPNTGRSADQQRDALRGAPALPRCCGIRSRRSAVIYFGPMGCQTGFYFLL